MSCSPRTGADASSPRHEIHRNVANPSFSKLGTDVTEFKVAGGKAYLAPVYDMASKEIVAWDVSRHPDMDQQKRLLAMLAERLPLARSRSCTATWDGSTSTNGGGTSSDASASASP